MLRLRAPAKINLTLEVLGRRADGYHEVRTILQAISLSDEIEFELAPEVSLAVEPAGAAPVEGNLVLKAAELLQRETGTAQGAAIRLTKGIPMAAGLGGGSSDAAAALLGLRRLWGIDIDADRLRELAAELGSDVPFFISGGTALAEGRGERLTQLPPLTRKSVVVMFSPFAETGDKTAQMYGRLMRKHYTDGTVTEKLAKELREAEGPESVGSGYLFNAFDAVASFYPAYEDMRGAFEAAGAQRSMLCGSGPSLFGLPEGPDVLFDLRDRVKGHGFDACAVQFEGPWPIEGLDVT